MFELPDKFLAIYILVSNLLKSIIAFNLKFLIKQGLNPRCNILLVLKDKREIPLFPAQFLLNPSEIEKKAITLSKFLDVSLENLII